ncbi:MAG TPA: hypothetical protein VH333_11030, partial [Pseudonocardiaceae bacterium]|nr:hypothetical protein [Pseudonocardiaceae bacterium]
AEQAKYDPFDHVIRAELEEFGDCLAEGVFWLLDQGDGIGNATFGYWEEFLDLRRTLVEDVVDRVEASGIPAERKQAMIDALIAARARSELIKPATCVDYLEAWQGDRIQWGEHVTALRREHQSGLSRLNQSARLAKALSELALTECSCLTMT